jgi:hypothetical protein
MWIRFGAWNVVVLNGKGQCSFEENGREEVKPDCFVSIFTVEIVGYLFLASWLTCSRTRMHIHVLMHTHTIYFHCEIYISAVSPFHLMLIMKIVTAMGV